MKTKCRVFRVYTVAFLAIQLVLVIPHRVSWAEEGLAKHEIILNGNAKGGVLTLIETLNRNACYVSIPTQSGESAESVAMRLAAAINDSDPFGWGEGMIEGKPFEVIVKDSTLTLPGPLGTYALAGTETGLGIPEPPTSLSFTYDSNHNQAILHWQNPSSGFDRIVVIVNGIPCGSCGVIGGSEESYALSIQEQQVQDVDFWVIGIRGGVPSNAASVHVHDNAQEELFGIPFTNGVAPNWRMWSYGTADPSKGCISRIEENLITAKGRRYNPIKTADAKPFKQILKTPAEGGVVGIWRKFLALTPSHTYRLSARLSTLAMDPNEQGWSFSLHAVADRQGINKLTENQMAGLTSLPDGRSGPQAGKIAQYGPGLTTKGEYVTHSADITLPADSNSITVWLRHTGKDTSGVALDWIKLEDLNAR